jgi:hypothetical protein
MSVPPQDESRSPGQGRRGLFAVSDTLPRDIPITDEEVRVLDAWFGDLLDELWGLEG